MKPPGPRASLLDATNTTFLLLNVVLFLAAAGRTPYWPHLLAAYLLLFLLTVAMGRFRASGAGAGVKRAVAFVYPVVFLFGLFETFFMLLPYLNDRRYDEPLSRIDLALLGVHPTVWLEAVAVPWLTDLMHLCYLFYFPMPLFPLLWLVRRGRYEEAERAMFVFLICYYVAYLGYFLVPAFGPGVHLANRQTVPLEGLVLTEPIRRLIDALEPNKLDAFPSLHAGILLTTMAVTFQAHRRMFAAFVPVAAGITLSLVYCRYHYVIDVLAGFAWAAVNLVLAPRFFARLKGRWAPHFGAAAP